jgi:Tfp pilus assembly protein PilV
VKIRGNEQGLTLVEIILTILIFGMAFMAIFLGLRESRLASRQSNEKTIAVNLARQQLETLKSYDDSGNDRTATVWESIDPYIRSRHGIDYEVTTKLITNQLSAGTENFRANDVIPIRVTVDWTSHQKDYSISLETCYIQSY